MDNTKKNMLARASRLAVVCAVASGAIQATSSPVAYAAVGAKYACVDNTSDTPLLPGDVVSCTVTLTGDAKASYDKVTVSLRTPDATTAESGANVKEGAVVFEIGALEATLTRSAVARFKVKDDTPAGTAITSQASWGGTLRGAPGGIAGSSISNTLTVAAKSAPAPPANPAPAGPGTDCAVEKASTQGYREGHTQGREDGRADGRKDAYKQSYDDTVTGRPSLTADACAESRAKGYQEGYKAGYELGYKQGKKQGTKDGRQDDNDDKWKGSPGR